MYDDLEGRFYEELEASAEEAVRDALYGEHALLVWPAQPYSRLPAS